MRGTSWTKRHPLAARRLIYAAMACVVMGIIGLAAFTYLYTTVNLPQDAPLPQASIVYDKDNKEITTLSASQNRTNVPLDQVSQAMKDAVIASEDHEFYKHKGVSIFGIMRAAANNLRGGATQGGSTISQQLVKNTYLNSEKTMSRKVKEAILAVKVERKLKKDEILERYLNTIYFGRGSYGVEEASRAFFNKHAKELSAEQSAYLVAALKWPSRTEKPDQMLNARNDVINSMVTHGKLSADQGAAAKAKPLGTTDARKAKVRSSEAAFFMKYVQLELSRRFPKIDLERGGYKIYTTYDPKLQQKADQTIKATLNKAGDPQAALVSIDDTGAIRALYGGSDIAASEVNLALGKDGGGSGRQPGSTFKPVVLARYLTKGGTLSQTFPAPASIDIQNGATPWHVSNYEPKDYGNMTVLDATAESTNTVYAQMIEQVGAQGIVDQAKVLGIKGDLPATPAVGLGAGSTSPLDMAKAYSVFMNEGTLIEPTALVRVTSPTKEKFNVTKPGQRRILEPDVANAVNKALQAVVEKGTGKAASIGRPVAGKTGTTSDYVDAWFVGYTPHITTSIWIGYPDDSSKKMERVHGIRVSGGSFPAQIFGQYMRTAVASTKADSFAEPSEKFVTGTSTSSTSSTSSSSSSSSTQPTMVPPPSITTVLPTIPRSSQSSSTSSTTSTTLRQRG